jgi:hypothetical protein
VKGLLSVSDGRSAAPMVLAAQLIAVSTVASSIDCYFGIHLHPGFENLTSLVDPAIMSRMQNLVHDIPLNRTAWADHPASLFARVGAVDWQDAWAQNVPDFSRTIQRDVASNWRNASTPSMDTYTFDYEPHYRPWWSSDVPTFSKPWFDLLAEVHRTSMDPRWLQMVGATNLSSAANWTSLDAAQQEGLAATSWRYAVRVYLTAAMQATRRALPAGVRFGNWNWPFKCGKSCADNATAAQAYEAKVRSVDWLWREVSVFFPDVYPEAYAGPLAERPPGLPARCDNWTAAGASSYYTWNADFNIRIRESLGLTDKVPVLLYSWYHYMCAQKGPVEGGAVPFTLDANVPALFDAATATGVDGVVLWGSVGTYGYEDHQVATVARMLSSPPWSTEIVKHCSAKRH